MGFMEVAEPPILMGFTYSTSDDEFEDTACSYFKGRVNSTNLTESQVLIASKFMGKRKQIDKSTKRTFCSRDFFVKKAECSSNAKYINYDKFEDNGSHESSDDDSSMSSPVPKRRKRLTAPAYFAILTGKKRPRAPVNISCRHECVESSDQSSVGSSNPEMSESVDSNSYKVNKKRLTAVAYRKLFKKRNI